MRWKFKKKNIKSANSSGQKTHLLTPEQQTPKGWSQATLPTERIHNYCTTLIFISTSSRFQVDPSSYGCQGSLLAACNPPCTLQASVEPETRCYTYSAPTRFSTLLMVLNCSNSKLTSGLQFTSESVRLHKIKNVKFLAEVNKCQDHWVNRWGVKYNTKYHNICCEIHDKNVQQRVLQITCTAFALFLFVFTHDRTDGPVSSECSILHHPKCHL